MMKKLKMMSAALVAACLSAQGAAIRDALVAPDLKDTRLSVILIHVKQSPNVIMTKTASPIRQKAAITDVR